MKTKRHTTGTYRTESINGYFGQIKKNGKFWEAEIRKSETGNIVRFAGIWNIKKDAAEECREILVKM